KSSGFKWWVVHFHCQREDDDKKKSAKHKKHKQSVFFHRVPLLFILFV
ncbi:hypothetical protein HMPREF0083_03186, partial [Aneurinibacillus aneurinilyticus ATCC 12856]